MGYVKFFTIRFYYTFFLSFSKEKNAAKKCDSVKDIRSFRRDPIFLNAFYILPIVCPFLTQCKPSCLDKKITKGIAAKIKQEFEDKSFKHF